MRTIHIHLTIQISNSIHSRNVNARNQQPISNDHRCKSRYRKSHASTLAQRGYRLSLGARNTADIDTSGLDCEVFTHNDDARDKQSAALWVEKTLVHYGTIDAVVLNAGVMKPVGVAEGSEEDLDLMWDVNFKDPLRLIRSALPALKRCGQGRVINIVSLSGKRVLGSNNLGY